MIEYTYNRKTLEVREPYMFTVYAMCSNSMLLLPGVQNPQGCVFCQKRTRVRVFTQEKPWFFFNMSCLRN